MGLTNANSDVYIQDPDTAVKYYMDCHTGALIPNGDLERDTIEWKHTYMEAATVASLWTIFLKGKALNVNIDDGHGDYVCKWRKFKRIKSGKKSTGYEMEFIVLSTRSSAVTIADYNGGNVVTLDFDPYPFPEPVKKLDGTFDLSFKTMYLTRAKADLLLAKFPEDVQVKLKSAGSTYYCRWNEGGLRIIPETEDLLSAEFSLTGLYYVGQAAASNIYIYDSAAANGIRMMNDPFPFPEIQKNRSVTSVKCCPGSAGVGQTDHYDGGDHISAGRIEFSVPYVSSANISTLNSRYYSSTRAVVHVSLDGGSTKYKCVPEIMQEVGYTGYSKGMNFKFRIIEQI